MKRNLLSLVLLLGLAIGGGACTSFETDPALSARHVVAESVGTLERFTTVPRLAEFAVHIPSARAVVVMPNLVKAGFIAGGEGGNGVLMARGADGQWRGPVFLSLGSASLGFQAGIQQTELVLLVRNEGALQSILKRQGSFGAEAGVTVAVFGAGMRGGTTTNLGADIFAFANSKSGLFGGASLEGAVYIRRRDLNEAFYGPGATPESILQGGQSNPLAGQLVRVLSGYSGAPANGPGQSAPAPAVQSQPVQSQPVQSQPLTTPRR